MPAVEVRPVRAEDLDQFVEATRHKTIRAAVATIDGVPAAIAGVAYHHGATIAFCECHDPLRRFPKAIIELAERALEIFDGVRGDVLAIKDASIPGSDRFLAWCGFEHVADSPNGEVYQWKR